MGDSEIMEKEEIQRILDEDWCKDFEERRKNRVVVSRYKYGPSRDNFQNKNGQGSLVDACKTAELCMKKYLETGNTEYLLDVGNYIMYEYKYPSVKGAYFKATSSSESAGLAGMSINEIKRMRENEF